MPLNLMTDSGDKVHMDATTMDQAENHDDLVPSDESDDTISDVDPSIRRPVVAPAPVLPMMTDPVDTWEYEEWLKEDDLPQCPPYSGPAVGATGAALNLGEHPTPLDCFSLFFDVDVWQYLMDQTNTYAAYVRRENPEKHKSAWTPATVQEIKSYMGMTIAMGILHLPRVEMYWRLKYPLLALRGLPEVFTRNRFQAISRYLHVCDKEHEPARGTPTYDKLYKVRAWLDLLSPRFKRVYNIGPEVAVDEAMIPYKGRLGFLQYMKNKPVKWGIKVWTLSDSRTGYIYSSLVYTGKDTTAAGLLCNRVVCSLLKGFEHTGLRLYTDNFYTNPDLCMHLFERGVYSCGTVRKNHAGICRDLAIPQSQEKRYEMGHIDWRTYDSQFHPLLYVRWKDKRMVYVLSTIHNITVNGEFSQVTRRSRGCEPILLQCPHAVDDYIKYMRGVDRGDQLISLYNSGRRTKKWWKRIFFHSLETAVLNAHIIHDTILGKRHPF